MRLKTKHLCYHEAGHAVACLAYWGPVESVSLFKGRARNNGADGECVPVTDWRFVTDLDSIGRYGAVLLAGPMAEERYRASPESAAEWGGDIHHLLWLTRNVPSETKGHLLDEIERAAFRLFADPAIWHRVEAIADCLFREGHIPDGHYLLCLIPQLREAFERARDGQLSGLSTVVQAGGSEVELVHA